MQEAKDPRSAATSGDADTTAAPETKEPGSEATSDETLSDLEKTEKVSGSSSGSEGSVQSSAPSPDGAFDEGGGRGPREDPGPM